MLQHGVYNMYRNIQLHRMKHIESSGKEEAASSQHPPDNKEDISLYKCSHQGFVCTTHIHKNAV